MYYTLSSFSRKSCFLFNTYSWFSTIRWRTSRRALHIRLYDEVTVLSCNSVNNLMNAACFHPIATIATCNENGSCSCRSSPNLMFRTIAAISLCS